MTQPVRKTDQHIVTQNPPGVSSPPGGQPIYGPNIFHIVNPNTGEVVERVDGYDAALRAQARWNGTARAAGV